MELIHTTSKGSNAAVACIMARIYEIENKLKNNNLLDDWGKYYLEKHRIDLFNEQNIDHNMSLYSEGHYYKKCDPLIPNDVSWTYYVPKFDSKYDTGRSPNFDQIMKIIFFTDRKHPCNPVSRYNFLDAFPPYDNNVIGQIVDFARSIDDKYPNNKYKLLNLVTKDGKLIINDIIKQMSYNFSMNKSVIAPIGNMSLSSKKKITKLDIVFDPYRIVDNKVNIKNHVTDMIKSAGLSSDAIIIHPYAALRDMYGFIIKSYMGLDDPKLTNATIDSLSMEKIKEIYFSYHHMVALYLNFMNMFFASLPEVLRICERDVILFINTDKISKFSQTMTSVGREINNWDVKYHFPKYPQTELYHTEVELKTALKNGNYVFLPSYNACDIFDGWLIYLECGYIPMTPNHEIPVKFLSRNVDIFVKYETSTLYNTAMSIVRKYHYKAYKLTVKNEKAQKFVSDDEPYKTHREKFIDDYAAIICEKFDKTPKSADPTITYVLGPPGTGKSTLINRTQGFKFIGDEYVDNIKYIDGQIFLEWEKDMHNQIKKELEIIQNTKLKLVLWTTLIRSYKDSAWSSSPYLLEKYKNKIKDKFIKHVMNSQHTPNIAIEVASYETFQLMQIDSPKYKTEIVGIINPPEIQYYHNLYRLRFEHRVISYAHLMNLCCAFWTKILSDPKTINLKLYTTNESGDLIPTDRKCDVYNCGVKVGSTEKIKFSYVLIMLMFVLLVCSLFLQMPEYPIQLFQNVYHTYKPSHSLLWSQQLLN